MPILKARIINLRPIVGETGPIGVGTPASTSTSTPPPMVAGFASRHDYFMNQVKSFKNCFKKEDIRGFEPEELDGHLSVALQDNAIVQDGDRYCYSQVAWRLRELTKGYVYERL